MLSAVIAAVGAGAFVGLAGPRAAVMLAARGQRQRIREDAPARHQQKAGTPTMGGILIIAGIAAASLLVGRFDPMILFGVAALLSFGAIGLLDDLLKTGRDRNLGLRARERLAVQAGAALVLAWYGMWKAGISTPVFVPGAGPVDLGAGYVLFAALLFMGFGNAVNLTDGLDGLAAGLVAMAALAFCVLAFRRGAPSVGVLAAAVAGGAAGFLRVNAHPARIMMGDVGSNALGAVLAALAMLTKAELALFVIGGVFVAEAASVFLQVAYFKSTGGRRIFRMSPLHHHFELGGCPETTVVRRFYWAGSICALLGLLVTV